MTERPSAEQLAQLRLGNVGILTPGELLAEIDALTQERDVARAIPDAMDQLQRDLAEAQQRATAAEALLNDDNRKAAIAVASKECDLLAASVKREDKLRAELERYRKALEQISKLDSFKTFAADDAISIAEKALQDSAKPILTSQPPALP